jgi:PPIC-type PPIASE domain
MRAVALLILVLLSACRAETRTAPAARIGSSELSAERLAGILVLSQPLPLERDVAGELAREWVNAMAVAMRSAAGDSLMEPDLIAEATWLDRRSALVDAWLRERSPDPRREAARIADSVYAAGDVRLFAHIFKRVGPETRPEEKDLQRVAMIRIREALIAGGAWRDANRESDDESSRAAGGIIGLVRSGDLVPEFERAAFALKPGQLSPVVETRYGYHIIHRPTLREARSIFIDLLSRERAVRADSLYSEELLVTHGAGFAQDAMSRSRSVAHDPWQALNATADIAKWDSGVFSEGDLARYLVHYPAAERAQLATATDEEVESFVRPLVAETLVMLQAEREGRVLPDSVLEGLRARYAESLGSLLAAADIARASLAVAGDAAARQALAARRVDEYMEAVASRRKDLQPVPPLLAAKLEGPGDGINADGLDAAVARARTLIDAANANRPGSR